MILHNRILSGLSTELPLNCRYDGITNLKRANVQVEFTEEQIEEIIKCSQDVVYFASRYCYIIDPDKGKTIIKLREYQKRQLKHYQDNRLTITLSSRQVGKSVISAIFIGWYTLFNPYKKSVILANKERTAKEIFNKVKLLYENLPYWLQIGVVEWNATSFKLENGSDVSCAATSASAIRGITANCVFLDEVAFIPRNIIDDFMTSVFPTISASQESKMILVSTPRGMNKFHELWKKAVAGKNSFVPFKIEWNEPPGRDEAWLKRMIKDMGEVKVSQEFLAKFIGSSKTLIKPSALEAFDSQSPINIIDENLYIYAEPIPGHTYIIGADGSKGVGGDYHVAQVIDITDETQFRQVAVFRNNMISPKVFANIIVDTANLYNEAFISIENNAESVSIIEEIWEELEYSNLIDFGTNKSELGIRATTKSKSKALDILKDTVDNNRIEIIDLDTIYELSKFIEVRHGIFKAEEGETDDCVSALYWALFGANMKDYFDREDIAKNLENAEEAIEVDTDEPLLYLPNLDLSDEELFQKELREDKNGNCVKE